MAKLSILSVSKGEAYALPLLTDMQALVAYLPDTEFVLVADGEQAFESLRPFFPNVHRLDSRGFIESILDEAVSLCEGRYVLRLDDDERCSPGMVEWLSQGWHFTGDHWQFPRVHLWRDATHALVTPQLFPDSQTRLSVVTKSGGRHHMHAPSPYGGGAYAPVCIEHHKFLIKTLAERRAIAAKWHTGNMAAFSVPEDVYTFPVPIAEYHGFGDQPWSSVSEVSL